MLIDVNHDMVEVADDGVPYEEAVRLAGYDPYLCPSVLVYHAADERRSNVLLSGETFVPGPRTRVRCFMTTGA